MELPRNRGVAIGLCLAGVLLTALGAPLTFGASHHVPEGVICLVIGLPLLVFGISAAAARTPGMRATAEGVWFGGGAVIPWRDIKMIYAAQVNVRMHGVRAKPSSISFDFHRKRTLFRAPVAHWLVSPFTVGDIDLRPDGASTPLAIAGRLEAMRTAAVGLHAPPPSTGGAGDRGSPGSALSP